MKLDARTRLFMFLLGGFVTSFIVGDLIGGRLYGFEMFGVEWGISAGMIPFPITFLLTDLLNEFYGKKVARAVTLVGFTMAMFTIAIVYIAGNIPAAPFTAITPECYQNAFMGSFRIFAASLSAYLIAQYTDIWVFHGLKIATRNRYLWLRATGSTAISQVIDTVAIQSLAWIGTPNEKNILKFIYTSYPLKLVIALALTPLIYAGHALLERRFNMHPIVLGPDGEALDPGTRPPE
jgi:queuosine precursor transporter